MPIETFDSESTIGYTQITTAYTDFSIAEHFGIKAIKDTYKNLFNQFKNNYKYLTELVMVLNWKSWRWYEENSKVCELYVELFEKCDMFACDNLKDKELAYFYQTTD